MTSLLTFDERANLFFACIVVSFPISNEICCYTSLRGAKPFKLKFRTIRGRVLALVAPLSASHSRNTFLLHLNMKYFLENLMQQIRGENIEICIFANADRNTISPNRHLIVIRWFYHDDTKNLRS